MSTATAISLAGIGLTILFAIIALAFRQGRLQQSVDGLWAVLARMEKTLANGNGVVPRLERAEVAIAERAALCDERHP